MTTYAWEKKESAGSWIPFDDQPTVANPTETFDAGTWDIRVTVTDGAQVAQKTRLAYVVAAAAPSYTGPLDLVPGAVVAYGVRALSAAMLGQNIFRLRRDSDDAEMNFAADAVTGDAPVASITAFLAGANGTFVTWYDQSGSGKNLGMEYAEPPYAAAQFGTVPAVAFDSNGAFVTGSAVTLSSGESTVFCVCKFSPGGNGNYAIAGMNVETQDPGYWEFRFNGWNATTSRIELNASADGGTFGGGITNASAAYDATNAVIDAAYDASSASIYFNNASQPISLYSDGAVGSISYILGVGILEPGGGGLFIGNMGEFILWDDKLSDANRLSIRQNEATAYGITLS